MGNKFVVKVYEHPQWRESYRGEDLAEALAVLLHEKSAHGSQLVVLEWR